MTTHAPSRWRRALRPPKRRQSRPELDVADIQGNVIRGYTYPTAAYVFARVDEPEAGRRWLTRLADQVTDARPWGDDRPETTLNAALTASGLAAVGVTDDVLATFPEEFLQGMAARAELLGDVGRSAPAEWEQPLGTGEAHVFLTLHAEHDESLVARIASIRDELSDIGGIEVVYEQHAVHPLGGRDHFGFLDGVSQPVIEGGGVEPRPGDGVFGKRGHWRAMKAGDFILGYVDEDGVLPDAPRDPLGDNGTYMIFRKLAMDVALFRRTIHEAAKHYPHGDEELLAAKVVGRWRDGTPLAVCPHAPDPAVVSDPARINDFRYEDDPDGLKCPIGAHIRRANPRDALGFEGATVRRHRIIRRGRPYGPPLPEGVLEDDGVERGLVFTCFNASIARQFELIQRIWVEDGDAFGLADDKDFLIADGRGSNKMTIQGNPPFFLSPQPGFVTTRGGEYLFRPGLRALRALGTGPSALR